MEYFRRFVVMALSILSSILHKSIRCLDESKGRCGIPGTCILNCHALKNLKKIIDQLILMISRCSSWAELLLIASFYMNSRNWMQETFPYMFGCIMEIFMSEMENNTSEKVISLSEQRRVCDGEVIDLKGKRRIYIDGPLHRATSDGQMNDVQESVNSTANVVDQHDTEPKYLMTPSLPIESTPVSDTGDNRSILEPIVVSSTATPVVLDVSDTGENRSILEPIVVSSTATPVVLDEPDPSLRAMDNQANEPTRQLPAQFDAVSDTGENRSILEPIVVSSTATPVVLDGTEQVPSTDLAIRAVTENRVTDDLVIDAERPDPIVQSLTGATRPSRRGVPPEVNLRSQLNTVDLVDINQVKTQREESEGSDMSDLNVNLNHDATEDDEG
ncbi:uncharacterized protein LOC127881316 [Dreissena polymorpha]|uniref:uncharacterized protein LOC127881316 n=1 Tax=Dreissena polymorpha TaxID=45954 RepID=UPI0022645F3F|nr:uncharacterized protein LOC127881316 [Dreissena polymorpha]